MPELNLATEKKEVGDFRLLLNRLNGRSQPIKVGNDVTMSIQAGNGLYSCPRANVVTEEYSEWEVAFINKQGEFVQPFCMEHDFDFGFGDQVLPYVKTEDVQRLYAMATNIPENNGIYPKVVNFSLGFCDDDEDEDTETAEVEVCNCAKCSSE